ncbi:hypothetical protein E8A77_01215 [Salmonella enterica subsp. enterica serovar Agbeni]|nr:hypothetical protein [Salmonella enterica subsp. enterica serovar Agbeni]ECY7849999.1 hypothetical protein [Salmonella enterica subsp. enterica serovar Agbeni]
MKPDVMTPADLARKRFTAKVRKQRNIDLLAALRTNSAALSDAIDYLSTGYAISTACGKLLDSRGEFFDIPRGNLNDEQYREILRRYSNVYQSKQSRPSVGAYLSQTYSQIDWLTVTRAALAAGAVGALMNRAPLGRMIYAELGGTAPDLTLSESAVAATTAIDVYSAATSPSVKITDHSPMFPGNLFQCYWGGLRYYRQEVTIRAGNLLAVRVAKLKTIKTFIHNDKIIVDPPIVPQNTLATVKRAEINEE